MQVSVKDSATVKFTDEASVTELIKTDFEGIINVPVKRINLPKLENMLARNECISSGEAYFTDDNILHVYVTQPTALYKIVSAHKVYYMTSDGIAVIPPCDWNEKLLAIRCDKLPDNTEWIATVGQMAQWMDREGELETIQEMVADAHGELTLKRIGHDEVFELGLPDDYQSKFYKIHTYITKIKPQKEAELSRDKASKNAKPYKRVNVKYSGQIVCK